MEGVEGWSVCVEGCVVEGCVVENAGRRIHFSFFNFIFFFFLHHGLLRVSVQVHHHR